MFDSAVTAGYSLVKTWSNKQIVKTVWFGEPPLYPVRSFTYRNEQVSAHEVSREIV
jgi:hypothetical protein